MLAILALTYGQNSPAEELLRHFALFATTSLGVCRP